MGREWMVVQGATAVCITSGANMNFDRLRLVSELAEVGAQREAMLATTILEVRTRPFVVSLRVQRPDLPAAFVIMSPQEAQQASVQPGGGPPPCCIYPLECCDSFPRRDAS